MAVITTQISGALWWKATGKCRCGVFQCESCVIERFSGEFLTMGRYINVCLYFFTFLMKLPYSKLKRWMFFDRSLHNAIRSTSLLCYTECIVITSAKRVMYLSRFVCPSVSRITLKVVDELFSWSICMGAVDLGTRNSRLYFVHGRIQN